MLAMSTYFLLKGTPLVSDIESRAAHAWFDIVGNVLLGFITAYPFWWIIESQMDSEKKARTLRLMKDFIYRNQFRITELASQIRNAKGQKRRTAHTMEDSLSDLNGFEAGDQTDEQRAALLHLIGRHYSYDREDMKRQFEVIHHYRNQFSLEFNQLMDHLTAQFNGVDALRVGQDDLQQTSIQAYLRLGENCQRLFDQLEKDYPSPKRKVKSK
jgi:hypothetical protein